MGNDLIIANLDKRQYVTDDSYGISSKDTSYMQGISANAVALLVCNSTEVFHRFDELAGSWFGDRIVAAGNNIYPPNQDIVNTVTADNPNRNLYGMVMDEFEDISLKVMLMMCRGKMFFAEEFANIAKHHNTQLFILLAATAIEEDCETMQEALERVNGPTWRNKYRRACEKYDIEPRA